MWAWFCGMVVDCSWDCPGRQVRKYIAHWHCERWVKEYRRWWLRQQNLVFVSRSLSCRRVIHFRYSWLICYRSRGDNVNGETLRCWFDFEGVSCGSSSNAGLHLSFGSAGGVVDRVIDLRGLLSSP